MVQQLVRRGAIMELNSCVFSASDYNTTITGIVTTLYRPYMHPCAAQTRSSKGDTQSAATSLFPPPHFSDLMQKSHIRLPWSIFFIRGHTCVGVTCSIRSFFRGPVCALHAARVVMFFYPLFHTSDMEPRCPTPNTSMYTCPP